MAKRFLISLFILFLFVQPIFALTPGEAHDYLYEKCYITVSDALGYPHTLEGKVIKVYVVTIHDKIYEFMAVRLEDNTIIDFSIGAIIDIRKTEK